MPSELPSITVRLPPPLHAEIELRAKVDGRSAANYVRRLIEAHVGPMDYSDPALHSIGAFPMPPEASAGQVPSPATSKPTLAAATTQPPPKPRLILPAKPPKDPIVSAQVEKLAADFLDLQNTKAKKS